MPVAPIGEFDAQEFRHLMEVNLFGALNALSEAVRSVADGGSVAAVTTSMVRYAAGDAGPYTASKAVAEVIRFLASAQASWVHGQIIQPNDGMV